jgi:5-enolpyruvylshikimate-3-phosphate synthase
MAMAFSMLGSCSHALRVDDKAVVNKTYPNYWQDYNKLIAKL